jgi:hypothetical protein
MGASSRLIVFDSRSPRPLPMPAERHHRQRDRRSGNPGYEARLNGALGSMASGEFKSLRQAAKARGVRFQSFLSGFCFTRTFSQVAKSTLSDRAKGRVCSYKKGDLQALARALHVSEDGTVDVLKDRIEEHLTGPEKVQLESNPRFSGLYPKPTQPRRRQAHTSHDENLPGVSNNPSSHPPPQNHHHTPSHSPPLPAPQHPFGQPLPPFNPYPYTHFPPYQMSYNHPYHYPPAHVYTAGGHSTTPITNTQDHHLYNLNSQ